MATIEEQIEATRKRLEQLKAQKQKVEAVKRAKEAKRTRAEDTRRKVLIGAAVLAKPNMGEEQIKSLVSPFLKRDDERALFGLQPLPKAVSQPQPAQVAA